MLLAAPLADAPDLARLGAAALSDGFASGRISPVEATEAVLDRAETIDAAFNAFTLIDRAGAIAAAKASETRWRAGEPRSPVDGIPTTLKDIVWARGWSVRYGSTTTAEAPYETDAPAVRFLREAGAVFIGQTTTPEFGWKAITDSALFGVTLNPHDRSKTPGGSSGGAAVAAATGAGVFHLGTDGGGSIRVPAAFTGIVGLKPSFGRVPAYPASAFGTVAHLGPMARSVGDVRAMLGAMSGRSLQDWAQGPGLLAPLEAGAVDLKGLRFGYWSEPPVGTVDPEVRAAVERAIETLRQAGARVEPVTLPGEDLLGIFHHHWFTGAAARLAQVPEAARAAIDPGFLDIARTGAAFGAADLVAAQVQRAEFGAAMDRLLARYDGLLSPGAAIPAFGAGLEVPAGGPYRRWTEWAGFSFPINLSQQPAVVIPCGATAGGLPIGLQIVGPRGEDARLLAIAEAAERAIPAPSAGAARTIAATRTTLPA